MAGFESLGLFAVVVEFELLGLAVVVDIRDIHLYEYPEVVALQIDLFLQLARLQPVAPKNEKIIIFYC